MIHLAIDIGASGGRHMIGQLKHGKLVLEEAYRFKNEIKREGDRLYWDVEGLFQEVLAGMRACREKGITPDTLGIDTWGVDHVLLDENDRPLTPYYAYRDSRTENLMGCFDQNAVYRRTGIQSQYFNTVYQLLATKRDHPEAFSRAERLLMLPEYFKFLLTGEKTTEYTNASTTALLDANAKDWDEALIAQLGLPRHIFGKIQPAGTRVGQLLPHIQREVGFDCTVLLPATHDTGSAVVSAPVDSRSIYLSSGTWSLIGVELKTPLLDEQSQRYNFTNEGGAEYAYRYLKNLTGLWMIQNLRREHGNLPYPALADMARGALDYPKRVDVDDVMFKAPENMTAAIRSALGEDAPLEKLLACVYLSLADSYKTAVNEMRATTGRAFERICIVGGGSQDELLNQLTANACGLPVTAGPVEATALGNIIVQMIASGEIENITKAREMIKHSFPMQMYSPQ